MNLAESIVLVYDPLKTAQGMLSFRAFRITQRYLDLVKYDAESGELDEPTLEEIRRSKLMSKDIFEEIPVALKTSHLANMLIFDLVERNPINPEKTVNEDKTGSRKEKLKITEEDKTDKTNYHSMRLRSFTRRPKHRTELSRCCGQSSCKNTPKQSTISPLNHSGNYLSPLLSKRVHNMSHKQLSRMSHYKSSCLG